jgi:hypothetical protein
MPNGTCSNVFPVFFATCSSPALAPLDDNEERHCNSKPDEACRYECILVAHVKPRGDPISLQGYASTCSGEIDISTYNSK